MLPCIFYIVMLILLLYYPHTLWEWLYLSKKKPAVYSRTTDFLYYSFYLLRCVSDKFSIFKHNQWFPLIRLHPLFPSVFSEFRTAFGLLLQSGNSTLMAELEDPHISTFHISHHRTLVMQAPPDAPHTSWQYNHCPPGIRPLSYLHRLPLRWTAPPKVSRQLLILYFFHSNFVSFFHFLFAFW